MEKTDKERITEYIKELRDYVGKDKIGWVLKELKTISLPEEYKLHAFQISSRFYSLKKKYIAGIIDNEKFTIERNQISYSTLELIKIIVDDPKLNTHWFFDDENYDTQIASTISQIAEDTYKGVLIDSKEYNEDVYSKFIDLKLCIEKVILELESKIYRGEAWGELNATIDNIDIVLKDKVDSQILDNLVKTVKEANIPRRSFVIGGYLDGIMFNLVNRDLIMSYKTSIGYIDGLLKLLKS